MSTKQDRASGKRPPKRIDVVEMAAILTYADLHTDSAAAKRFGLDERTIRRRRKAIVDGEAPELAALVQKSKAELAESVSDELGAAYKVLLARIVKLAPRAKLSEATQALSVVGELKINRDMLVDEGPEAGRTGSAAAPGSGQASAGATGETGSALSRTLSLVARDGTA